jgi:aminomethyltransferase
LPERTTPGRTALYEAHTALGARFTEFGGWEMPVRYGSIIDEHHAVRHRSGLFDLSHMGELRVAGSGAAEGLSGALVSDPGRLAVGRAGYSLLCAPDGGVIDDLIVYRVADEVFLVVPNASNREIVAAELADRLAGRSATVVDETMSTSLVAIQGPAAAAILGVLTDLDLGALRGYGASAARVAGIGALVARTGYTGEDGFEIFTAWAGGPAVWAALLDAGEAQGLLPCGLGARDTLRLEAGMPLYGQELDRSVTPYDAGLGWAVKLDHEFVGRDALAARAAGTGARQLVGLVLEGRAIARHGASVMRPGEAEPMGIVTSGSQSPTLGHPIAMAYVPPSSATAGTMLDVAVRGTAVPAEVVSLPFYRRSGR